MRRRSGSHRGKSSILCPKVREGDNRTCLPLFIYRLIFLSPGYRRIIHKLIEKEEQYVHDLDIVETFFISPLRLANPPVVVLSEDVEQFIDNVFLNVLELRECNRRLLENMYVRQREQAPVVQQIGDILLEAATEFRKTYPQYVGRNPIADKMLKDELERNAEFRLFIEVSYMLRCILF